MDDFNDRNKCLLQNFSNRVFGITNCERLFPNQELVSKFDVGSKSILHLHVCLSEPGLYGELVYKFKKIMGRTDFSDQFRKVIIRYITFSKHI